MKLKLMSILFMNLLFFVVTTSTAQNTQVPESLPRPPASAPTQEMSQLNVNFGGTWSPRVDLEGGGGFSRDSWTGDVGLRFPIPVDLGGSRLFFSSGLSYTGTFYNFSGHPDIAGSDRPWNQVNVADIHTGLFCQVDEHWGTFASFDLNSAAQTGADMEQSFTYGGVVGADYRFSDRLSVGLAIVARSRLEQSVLVLPFPSFSWVLPFDEDRWRAFSGGGSSGSGGAGETPGVAIGIAYHPIKPLTFAAGISSLGLANDFRLNARSAIPNGVVEDEFSQFVFSTEFRPDKHVAVSGFIGADLPGKLKVLNSAETAVYTERYSIVPVVGLNLSYRF